MQYMPGWTVQCLNPECMERGHWLRVQDAPQEICRELRGAAAQRAATAGAALPDASAHAGELPPDG